MRKVLFAGLLMFTGCQAVIPGSFPILPVGTIPTAADIQEEKASTNALRNDLLIADSAVDIALPNDAKAADTLYEYAANDLNAYDASYANGTAGSSVVITVVEQIIQEIRDLKSTTMTPAKAKALAHAASLSKSQSSIPVEDDRISIYL